MTLFDPHIDRGDWKAVSPNRKHPKWQKGTRVIQQIPDSGFFVISDCEVWMQGSYPTWEEAIEAHRADAAGEIVL